MSRQLTLQNRIINDDSDCYVIAEIGHNHQGSLEKAVEMFHHAKMAGVDAVKLQKRDNKTLFTKAAYNKPYENENSFGKTYGEHREALEFGKKEYSELARVAKELDLHFFSTAFDIASADFLAELGMQLYKIASADLTNLPLLKHVARIGKPMIISTGGANLEDVQRAMDTLLPINAHVCILQCTATYPTQAEDLHLRVITTLREAFPNTVVGLSDHYNGIAMAPVAYVLGARVIEKHFTLNHTMKGTDHALSLEPIGMHKMVRDLQRTRQALGSAQKVVLPQEKPAITKMAKSLFAAHDLAAGHVLEAKDIAVKSPGGGVPPWQIESLIGRKLPKAFAEDEAFTTDLVR